MSDSWSGIQEAGRVLVQGKSTVGEPDASWWKVPASLTPRPAQPVDVWALEARVVFAAIVAYQQLNGRSPNLRQLCNFTQRTPNRVKDAIAFLVQEGSLVQLTVPYRYAPGRGRVGTAYRFAFPQGSPALKDIRATKVNGRLDGAFVQVPMWVGRLRSVLAVALWLVMDEQIRLDGVVTSTASELGDLLGCSSRHVLRLLGQLRAQQLVAARKGFAFRTVPGMRRPRQAFGFYVADELQIRVEAADRETARKRLGALDVLRKALGRAGVDANREVLASVRELTLADGPPTLRMVMRLLEERFRDSLSCGSYRYSLARRAVARFRCAEGRRVVSQRTLDEIASARAWFAERHAPQ